MLSFQHPHLRGVDSRIAVFPVMCMLHSDMTEETFGFLAWRLARFFGSGIRHGAKVSMVQGDPFSKDDEDFPDTHNFNIVKTDGDKALQVNTIAQCTSFTAVKLQCCRRMPSTRNSPTSQC